MDNPYSMSVMDYIECGNDDRREDFENHVFENVWDKFVRHLPTEQDYKDNSIDVWYCEDDDEILCRTEQLAEMIADIIEDISGEKHMVRTGYYDPDEDALEENGPFPTTGWYYIDWD